MNGTRDRLKGRAVRTAQVSFSEKTLRFTLEIIFEVNLGALH